MSSIFCCKPYKHGNGVAKYLSKYVKRSPFKNSQIKVIGKTHMSFVYQSHQTGKQERMHLSHTDFIKRLLQHVPLKNKPVVRYSGLYNGSSRKRLDKAKKVLGQIKTIKPETLKWEDYLLKSAFRPACKVCGLPIHHEEVVARKKVAA